VDGAVAGTLFGGCAGLGAGMLPELFEVLLTGVGPLRLATVACSADVDGVDGSLGL
jgi:hypothetical protein